MDKSKPSTSNEGHVSYIIEEDTISIICKECNKTFPIKSIVHHTKKSKCSTKCSLEEVSNQLNQISIICKSCNISFSFKSIVQHVNKSECSTTYSKDKKALENIQKKS